MVIGLVTIGEGGVGTGIIAIRLARLREGVKARMRWGWPAKRAKNSSTSHGAERFRVAQMSMRVHEPISRRRTRCSRLAENMFAVRHDILAANRTARAVETEQTPLYNREMFACLLGREKAADDRVNHRKKTVGDASRRVARMQQIVDAILAAKKAKPATTRRRSTGAENPPTRASPVLAEHPRRQSKRQ